MNCQQFKEMMDSYISNELLIETNHDVLHHLENCPACRETLSAQRNFRLRLRLAVKNTAQMQLNPAFAANLQNRLRETALRPSWWDAFGDISFLNTRMSLAAAAICLLVVWGGGVFWSNYRNSPTDNFPIAENQSNAIVEPSRTDENLPPSESVTAQAVQAAWSEITEFAIGDHKNCALKFRLKEKPITLEEASRRYGEFNRDLDKAVIEPLREAFPADASGEIKLVQAHSCVYDGRRFAHVVLRRQNHIISVLITDADLPNQIDQKIVSQTTVDLQVAGFRTKNHAIFIVSDLSLEENSIVANVLMPAVRKHLEKFEA